MNSSARHFHPWLPLVEPAQALGLLQDCVVRAALASWVYLLASSALFLAARCLLRPLSWCRDLSEVGYNSLADGGASRAQRRGKSRRELVREVRHLRKVGALPPVYPNGWFVLLESCDLLPGQAKHVPALGENFAVFRTEAGEAHVLDAYCPHLGANMGVGGAVRGDCIQCPFHGWAFSGVDGRCKSVPYSDKAPSFAHVKKWKSVEMNSFIFVWYHAEGVDPTWWPEPKPEIEEKKWVYRGRNEFIINAHIQEIPENGGDVAHLTTVHGPSILNGSDLRSDSLLWQFSCHEWIARWDPDETPGRAHVATMRLRHEIRLFQKIGVLGMDVRARQIGPAYVELDFTTSVGNMTILQCVTPLEPMLQKVIHRLYCPRHMYLYATIALWGESIMFERDVMVWNHKTYIEKPLLVKEDRNIARHRRWFSQFYSEHSPRFQFRQESLDW
ncbi:cholesterol 7-desaturase nvd [Bacillus rossius redtenbacheri]|uniref:cholesterol 7-desaturase nvd n=1 Tax=Bacillus rossius redtenbacheri TaxID=93214 RepID=UPI002FDEDD1F